MNKCESVGLHPKLGPGYHTQIADGVFEIYMKELGLVPPAIEMMKPTRVDWFKFLLWTEKPKGRSTLTGWICPECELKVRVGIKGDPQLIHEPCSAEKGEVVRFVRL